ncbi:hypothetical protein [Baekduia alba]|uniref:hypothetical protein n=1 Tax=Baekduia alba TaxID=2997333 RepID=UPI0023413200|nr:hypothetical protein [Baekduia alba]
MPREPLVVLHGVTMSARLAHRVRPLLELDVAVVTPTALGHSGGRPAIRRARPDRARHTTVDGLGHVPCSTTGAGRRDDPRGDPAGGSAGDLAEARGVH